MGNKKNFFHSTGLVLAAVVIATMIFAASSKAYAQEAPPLIENGTCASCHENLYFLHDTGNWFCIREAPMRCVDCHGGDPSGLTQDEAHSNRQAHPIIGEDASRCQECHLDECMSRVEKIDEVVGLSDVMIAVPLQSKPELRVEAVQSAPVAEPNTRPAWISALEILVLVVITALALTIFFAHGAQNLPQK